MKIADCLWRLWKIQLGKRWEILPSRHQRSMLRPDYLWLALLMQDEKIQQTAVAEISSFHPFPFSSLAEVMVLQKVFIFWELKPVRCNHGHGANSLSRNLSSCKET